LLAKIIDCPLNLSGKKKRGDGKPVWEQSGFGLDSLLPRSRQQTLGFVAWKI